MDNRENMPCFDPRDVMFLTNQWDTIDNDDEVSQLTQTWNFIKEKLNNEWGWLNVENVFRISLKQVNHLCICP